MDYNNLIEAFKKHYQTSNIPRIFRAPGRINLIGEHTDYNDGFVLPAAVNKEIALVILPNNSEYTNIYAYDQRESVSFKFTDYKNIETTWAKYIIGVMDELRKAGHKVEAVDILFSGNIPMGAGMSSSAALECATVFAYNEIFNLELSNWEIAKLAQSAENNFVGVMCGIMDQFASIFSEQEKALKLDCRSHEFEAYPLQINSHVFVLVDTMVKHSLASSEYNVRRYECEKGVEILKSINPKITSLRDAELDEINGAKDCMEEQVFKRCSYVVNENARVNEAVKALEDNNFVKFGQLLYETHHGLQNNYEVSCPELDFLVDSTKPLSYVLGSRMMGGGFGGCTINLVEASKATEFESKIKAEYQKKFNIDPEVYTVKTASGTSEVKL